MQDESFIHIDHVSKRFGSFAAVDDANVKIQRGEFFSLLGPSGCGKTTLLRMIAGFEFPTEGKIFIDSQDVSSVPANRRPTNMVFQSYAIFPHLNVRDNIGYGLRRAGLSRKEIDARVEEALLMVKLAGLGLRRPDQLSGGQRQRVALARALIKRPKVLLLDEPLSALDKKLREDMQIELRLLQKSVGITFVFVTHDQEEALSLSDRVAVMFRGKILQIATPRELYEVPNGREVADFIGTMNFIKGTVRGFDSTLALIDTQGLGQIKVPLTISTGGVLIQPGADVLAAIRPEKLSLSTSPPADGSGVKGKILASAYLGDRSHHQVFVEGRAEPIFVSTTQSDRSIVPRLASDTPVYLNWEPEAVVLLPPE
jgi:spermidine/putrescine transport system ATP-binding protein/putrescine transport system ATP-binding protein